MTVLGKNLTEPYKAFENNVSYQNALKYDETGNWKLTPDWLRDAIGTLKRLPENEREKYWDNGTIALSVGQVLEEHSGEVGFDYKEMYSELSNALARAKITKKDGNIGSNIVVAMKIAILQYFKKQFSDFWLGKVEEEVSKTEEVLESAPDIFCSDT